LRGAAKAAYVTIKVKMGRTAQFIHAQKEDLDF
jgi:hypothetical protein